MDSLKEKENNSIKEWMDDGTCLAVKPIGMYDWFETDDDCAQFCRYLGPEEFELVQINRYLADTVFYTVSYGTICLQDYFMEQIDSILKSYGYRSLNYGTYGSGVEVAPSNQLIAEMVFETYFREFEEDVKYRDYAAAGIRVKEIISMG
ncbi:hypothetical protein [Enterocloster bolteae]|uniref:hypothetical protein n=1 Tax=Enterocloster bolteae TaxID=208479 RepID=UPI0028DB516C|nr:hypothetical protein [Enterocloster bolteae]